MDCHEVQRLLPLLDDGTLDSADEQSAHVHIDSCPECRGAYDAHRRMLAMVQTAYSEDCDGMPRIDLHDAIHRGIEQRRKAQSGRRFVYAAAAAVMVAATALTGFLMNRSLVPELQVAEDTEGWYEYVADMYASPYDLVFNAGDDIYFDEEELVPEEVLASASMYVSMEDMINNIDEEELSMMLAMGGF